MCKKANTKTALHRVSEICYGLQSSFLDYCKQRCRSVLRQSTKPGSKLICGAIRTTPTATCKIDAKTKPRDLTRKRSLMETVEKYRRQEPDHANRKLIETWKPVGRIQHKTLLDVAKEMLAMENLPNERELERNFQNVSPWQHLHQPKTVTSPLDKKTKQKEAEPNNLNYVPRKQLIATVHQLSMLTQMGPHSKRQ